MMSSFQRVFTFVVGPNKKEFSIHEAAFSELSCPLEALLSGPYKESQTLRVEWPDIDEGTFIRFARWAYTGSYVTEEPDIILDRTNVKLSIPSSDGSDVVEDGDNVTPEEPLYSLQSIVDKRSHHRRPGTKRHGLIQKFLDMSAKYPTTTSDFKPRQNKESCEEYTGVFLCHAKLYVLGDAYDIPQLRQLSLHHLHATLKEFTLYPSRLNDIAALARYIFNNTQAHDEIQDMIGHYYACIFEDASKQQGLNSLISEMPDFALSLISSMSKRLD
ncbi:hypothetical protein N0V82_001215 [Gnomoniopsis sp. IMI 355080]|nr:hypothetical protein N0V82_001215 [Gnomoniopsis sp. IMI 355080]